MSKETTFEEFLASTPGATEAIAYANAQQQKYNGWKNYETWLVGLWLGNDEQTYSYWQSVIEECREAVANGDGNPYADTPEQAVRIMLTDRLKETIENSKDDLLEENKLGASMWADLLGAALGSVDWVEIADHMLD